MPAMNQPRQPLLTQEETAAYLGVKSQTLATWRCTGRYPLRFIRVGKAIRYRAADVEKFLTDRTVAGDGSAITEASG